MVPVLSIYGTDDQSVPNAQSIDLAAAQPDLVQLLEVDGAGHVQSFDVDYQGYVDRVLEFLDEVS
jgi:pimeloyl-ACP methyl ester carboxylesterase